MEGPTPTDISLPAALSASLLVVALALAWYRPRLVVYTRGELVVAAVATLLLTVFSVLTLAVVQVAHSPHYWDPAGRRLGPVDGIRGALFVWAAWATPPLVGLSAWGARPWRACARDAGFLLVALLASGLITATWTRSG